MVDALRRLLLLLVIAALASPARGAPSENRRHYEVGSGDAVTTLRQFAEQSGEEIVFVIPKVRGVKTKEVKGEFTSREVIKRMVAGTVLRVMEDEKTGAILINRAPDENKSETAKPLSSSTPEQTMKRKNPLTLVGSWLALAVALHGAEPDVSSFGTIEGRVANAGGGEYLEKARVSVAGTNLETFTDSSGQYRISRVPAGTVQAKAFYTGVGETNVSIVVEAGKSAHYDFNLGAGGEGAVTQLAAFRVDTQRETDGAAIAINQKRFAPNMTNVVAANEFGVSADGSVGEFIKYLPGISINYVGGTANTISIDGVPTNNVPVTVGGFDMASTSSASTSRSSELLQLSIQNLSRLEVIQSPTPESPGSALAGSINLVPRSAFEFTRPVFQGSAYAMMRDNWRDFEKTPGPMFDSTRKVRPGFDFSYVVPVNSRFGFTVSGSYSNQFIPQDTAILTWRGAGSVTTGLTAGTAAQYPTTTVDNPYLTDFTLLDERKFNVRTSAGATLDYKLTNSDTLSFSYQYGTFSSEYTVNNLIFAVNRVDPGNFGATFTNGNTGSGRLQNTTSSRWRGGATNMPTLTYRHVGALWNAEAGLGYSDSTNHLRDSSRGYFGSVSSQRANVTVSYSDIFYLRPGKITVTDGTTGAAVDPYNLSNYTLTAAGNPNPRDSHDVRRTAYANLSRKFMLADAPFTLKGGLDVRDAMRDIRGSSTTATFAGPNNNASIFTDNDYAEHGEPFGFPATQWISGQQAWQLYQAHPEYFVFDQNAAYRNAVSFSKRAQETISSGFVRGDLSLFHNRLKLIGGVRVEQTNVRAEGPLTDPTRNFQRDASGKVVLSSTGTPVLIVPTTNALGVSQLTFLDRGQTIRKEYLRLFPSVNASYNVLENLIARAAYYTSVGRPDYNQYAGGITLPNTESPPSATNVITVNNVGIKAWSAETFKARIEYYFDGVGQFSIGGFRRRFKNFFGSTQFAATPDFLTLYNIDPNTYGSYNVATQFNLPSPVNMSGFDVDYKQSLKFLPTWASGVQVFANASFLHTSGAAAASASLDGSTPRTYNWGFSLTRKKYDLRVGWNYSGLHRLSAVAAGAGIDPGTYQWASKRLKVDFQAEYFVWRSVAVFMNLRNLTDATEDTKIFSPRTPAYARFRERDDFGASWTFGVKGTF